LTGRRTATVFTRTRAQRRVKRGGVSLRERGACRERVYEFNSRTIMDARRRRYGRERGNFGVRACERHSEHCRDVDQEKEATREYREHHDEHTHPRDIQVRVRGNPGAKSRDLPAVLESIDGVSAQGRRGALARSRRRRFRQPPSARLARRSSRARGMRICVRVRSRRRGTRYVPADAAANSRRGCCVVSERSLTRYSEDMVYTIGIWGEPRCPGRSVNRWMNASDS
jgi:hypothetical protein